MSSPLYAVIDLGSNSFHMLITRQLADSVQIVDKVKRKVRLASGLDKNNNLSAKSIARGLECMRFFAERLQDFPKQNIRIVATATLRLANNRDTFLQQANQILGHNITLLSGEEEAKTIYKGVAYTSNILGNKLVFDIGGASTEIIIGENIDPIKAVSLDIGCVTFNQAFFATGELTQAAFRQAIEHAKTQITPVVKDYQDIEHQVVLGGSGTMQALAEMLMYAKQPTLIDYDFLIQTKQQLIDCKSFDNIALDGLVGERIPVFASGLCILIALFESFQVDRLHLSSGALREGLLYDMLPTAKNVDIAALTINSMMSKYHVEQDHGARVLYLAKQLFDAYAPTNAQLGQQDAFILSAACQLHEIGLLIEYKQHQHHGAYIIQHSQMLGFNQSEKQTLAMLVQQQKDSIKKGVLDNQLLPKTRCLAMLMILRVAIILASRRQQDQLPILKVSGENKMLVLTFDADWLSAHPLIKDELSQEAKELAKFDITLTIKPS